MTIAESQLIVLAIETTGSTAAAALVREGGIIAELSVCNDIKHSKTLMPMIDFLLQAAELRAADIGLVACSAGPGSFTGLRIGAATAKGLACGLGIKIAAVPTLDALAYNVNSGTGLVVPMMDARRGQVYAALYVIENGECKRISDYLADSAQTILDLAAEHGAPAVFLGDGADLHRNLILQNKDFAVAPPGMLLQRSANVGFLGLQLAQSAVLPGDFELMYIRLSQAERNICEIQ